MPRRKLTDRIRAEIVSRFATWSTSTEVQEWLKETHGIDIGLPGLTPYRYDNPLSRKQGTKKWVQLFDEVRATATAGVSSIPIANRARRLQIANDLVERLRGQVINARGSVNVVMVEKILAHLEYAAKETGGQFERERRAGRDEERPEDAEEFARRVRESVFQMDQSLNVP